MKIFGREPAVWAAAIQAIIAFFGPNVFHWSLDQTALIYGIAVVVLDLYVAYRVKQTMLALVVALVKLLLSAFMAFGGNLNPDTAAQLVALLTGIVGGFQRQTSSHLDSTKGNFDLAA